MDRIDEMTNEELQRRGHSDHILRDELGRVDRIFKSHVLTGADLSYWIERRRILNSLIFSGTRVG